MGPSGCRGAGERLESRWGRTVSRDDDPSIELRVLGTVQLLLDGSPVATGGPKQRGVLAMLVLGEGHPVSVSRLIDGIWGAESPSGARGLIHSYVAELRRSLGPDWRAALRTVGDGYSLELPARTTDLDRFRRLVEQARHSARHGDLRASRGLLAAAVAECRGELLSDVADLPFAGPAQVRLDEVVMNAARRRSRSTWFWAPPVMPAPSSPHSPPSTRTASACGSCWRSPVTDTAGRWRRSTRSSRPEGCCATRSGSIQTLAWRRSSWRSSASSPPTAS